MEYLEFRRLLTLMLEDLEDIQSEIIEERPEFDSCYENSPAYIALLEEYSQNNVYASGIMAQIEKLFLTPITQFTLTENIFLLCKTRGMSIYQLEKTLGLSNGSVKRWKNQSPSLDKIVKIADYFSVSLDSLINRTTESSNEVLLKDILNNQTGVKVIVHDEDREKIKWLTYVEKNLLLSLAHQINYPDEEMIIKELNLSQKDVPEFEYKRVNPFKQHKDSSKNKEEED